MIWLQGVSRLEWGHYIVVKDLHSIPQGNSEGTGRGGRRQTVLPPSEQNTEMSKIKIRNLHFQGCVAVHCEPDMMTINT